MGRGGCRRRHMGRGGYKRGGGHTGRVLEGDTWGGEGIRGEHMGRGTYREDIGGGRGARMKNRGLYMGRTCHL